MGKKKLADENDGLERRKAQKIFGGLAVEMSKCCDAQIILTQGGLRHRICSKCKKAIWETTYKS